MNDFKQYIETEKTNNEIFLKELNAEEQKLEFAFIIKQLRETSNLFRREFAVKAGKPLSTITRIENGNMKPSIHLLNDIAVSFGKKVEIKFV